MQARDVGVEAMRVCGEGVGGGRRKKGGVRMESGALSETAGACAWGRRGGGERNAESG